jgi:RNA polymerase sigma-70 factor (ECF subfamily)
VDTRVLPASAVAPATSDTADPDGVEAADFDAIYEGWFHEVCRWLGALGAADGDVDDLAQEVFLVVRRKLDRFDGANLPGWLYRIAARTASDHRRRAWFRHLLRGRREVALDELAALGPTPLQSLERNEAQRLVHGLLARMSEKRRTAFALFEIEGYSGEEIAALQGIPVATVWTRLHHARRDFLALVEELQAKERACGG